ncbi:NAD-dependent epimerase/dehydratase family protein [Actinocatenispora comari]|jgi:UDP-glucose 4-epimerase|uniref:NAD dependent epimerase/dehydratase n=1 Tax=Actinocatenispora comari TaxID=2807577 RepID=A0A8J4A9E7_9ACTN|nr:NAD-dependent epimerase/dehydratase family protein [Actinocatenispora comari]GIL25700.1 NAD dependent epimerase/dehydratase [Actinocatenispora comari]
MQVLVTGGAGFVGSRLIRGLLAEFGDIHIVSVDNYFTGTVANHVDDERVEYLHDSTVNVRKLWADRGGDLDAVFHLGEYSRIPQSFDEPDRVWEYNMYGTKEVVALAQEHGAKLVYAGSSSKFGNGGQDENLNPYAWIKAKNVEYIRNVSDWYGLDYVVTYFYNVYGPGQITDGPYATVIGIFERQYAKGEPLTVVEPGTQTRDFTHVDDIVSGIITCYRHGSGDGYLLGYGQERSLLSVAKLFDAPYVLIPARRGERTQGQADTSKARALGWQPTVDLPDYIARITRDHA